MNDDTIDMRLLKRTIPSVRGIGIAVIAAGLTTVMAMVGSLAPLDRATGDILLRLTHRNPGDVPVTAVVIDDKSIAIHGPLPWPRSRIAEIVVSAHRGGAAAVALDLLLPETGAAPGDLELNTALSKGPTLVAAAIGRDGEWLLPHSRFGGAERAAHVHAEIGPDGVARTLIATKQALGLSLPALSLAATRVLKPEIVIEPGAILRPDFRPGPDTIHQVSAADFLSSSTSGQLTAGRLVFIGITATGAGDRLIVPTTLGPSPSQGVLVHASAAASIFRNGLVVSPGPLGVIIGIFLAALGPQILRNRIGVFKPWIAAAVAGLIFVIATVTLEVWHLLLPVPALIVGLVLSTALREGFESRAAQRESGHLLQSLLRHHDPERGSQVPKSSMARLAAIRDLQTSVLAQDAARRTLLDGMHDGVVMWDSDGRIAVVNPAAVRLWGRGPTVTDFTNLENDHPESGSAMVHRHGRELAISVFAIGDGGMALLRDVTAQAELERKRRDMQRLVSHELKTPLASIAGFGETLQRYELTPGEQHRVASLIRGESERLGEMVSTFLDLERLGSDQFTEPTRRLDLGSLVGERLEILSQAARTRGQNIVPTIETGVTIHASSTLLGRVIDNLVGNALKYSADDGSVEVGVTHEDERAILTIADHGAGIPPEAVPRIFERFYRVPGVESSGSGLGLAVAREVVTWHGGCIEVQSIVGQGSTFMVRLPTEE